MKHTSLPRRRLNTADYPNVDTDYIGKLIPVGYGTLADLVPVQIDTSTRKFKILDHAIEELTEVRSATKDPLVEDLDYTADLANGEFTLIFNVKITTPGTYYFAIESDYDISGTNYFGLSQADGQYADGRSYEIDSGDTWVGAGPTDDLVFTVWGKTSPSAGEVAVVSNDVTPDASELGLKDAAARTKIGQSFYMGTSPTYYITKITVKGTIHGSLTGKNLRARIYSDTAGTQVGNASEWIAVAETTDITFAECNENTELTCDVKAPGTEYDQVADILPHMLETVMGKASGLLDSTELANLATDKTQQLRVLLKDTAIEFGDFVAKLEAGQIWKLVPFPSDTYGTIVPETGEPGNLLTLRDHDFLSFRMEVDIGEMMQAVNIDFAEDLVTGEFLKASASSDVARFFYLNESAHDVETFLLNRTDADALAAAYLARFEVPIIRAVFEIHAKGAELLPWRDKVKLYRERAAYGSGSLDGVLFRIVKLIKKPESNRVEITAAIWGNSAT